MPEMPALPDGMRWEIKRSNSRAFTHALCLQSADPGYWFTLESRHFDVGADERENAEEILSLAEEILAHLTPNFGGLTGFHMDGKKY
ncbi:hypothetical protein SEA_SPEEDDEMON_460 [Gordonia phage SpeedDemon]|uniref:Uncharacterized protein n=1 Tax=Gordonia phage Bantam TaxID=1887641 RepID=A0A1B3AYA8_9CAUD|nr:hypothetical protein BIZ77_gp133 [Gordonia phage Bantam]AOE43735.1 hypothetical protein SEA_BANTAM_45 [Gordonia phage Bantam]QNL30497.1 hypothetical protein SEA_SPEEDDEMON_460 [Gordonia phage SpeedDemon]